MLWVTHSRSLLTTGVMIGVVLRFVVTAKLFPAITGVMIGFV
jgi:hypothetical protein